jgi:PucR C-terminal helix-turn-helix domain
VKPENNREVACENHESAAGAMLMNESLTHALYAALEHRLDVVTPAITARIRAEVPGYAELPYEAHEADVDRQIRNVVGGLVANATPGTGAIDHARGVGRRRAAAGMALPDVVEAYHIAYREIWSEVLADAHRAGAEVREALTAEVGLLWLWFHRLSAAVAEAHAAEARERHSSELALHRDLVDQLLDRAPHDDAVAAELGYDIDRPFMIARVDRVSIRDAELISATFAQQGERALCVHSDGRGIVIAQDVSVARLARVVRAVRPEAFIGVGLPRLGMQGAAVALVDATDALRRAGPKQPLVEYAEDWLMSSLSAVAPRFEVLLEPGRRAAREHPHLAEAVRAYAASRYSVSGCARTLHIHANSARYRLDRWKAVTGWDVETFPGLAASLVALDLPSR